MGSWEDMGSLEDMGSWEDMASLGDKDNLRDKDNSQGKANLGVRDSKEVQGILEGTATLADKTILGSKV
ncbi:unnamed protein product, partial [Nesidiocoris tenuis]